MGTHTKEIMDSKNHHSKIKGAFNFDNSYAEQLEGFYVPFQGEQAPSPSLLKLNKSLADELGLQFDGLADEVIAQIFSGSVSPEGAAPLAQAYAGHQFGQFSPQLGDGRALLLGEVVNRRGERCDIHLKGSGRTPFSRGGDGKAALGPVLREYIVGEAMFALNVPTTRALAAVSTGEQVMRTRVLPGAVLARVASSHIRVGTFQFFAAQGEVDKVRQLADYTIQRHFSDAGQHENPYLALLCRVSDQQAELVARWMLLGFIHGVMNTDNMTVSGETIDYGPCAFMDEYNPDTVFSSIDTYGRYAYQKQPIMAQWNLARFAETLLPLIDENSDTAVELATQEIQAFFDRYQNAWTSGMRAKLGLMTSEENDFDFARELFRIMDGQRVDFTLFFRGLAKTLDGHAEAARELFDDSKQFDDWYRQWLERIQRDSMTNTQRVAAMNSVNPVYIPRNHKVEEALHAAEEESDLRLFERLMQVLERPFEERSGLSEFAHSAPEDFGPYQTFCGT